MQTRKFLRRIALAGGVLALTAISASAAGWGTVNLSGKWNCPGGDTYYVRQQADQVFWYGENSHPQPGSAWRNVAHGFFDQKTGLITLAWADVQNRNSPLNGGLLVLRFDGSGLHRNQLIVTESTNTFPKGWSCYQ